MGLLLRHVDLAGFLNAPAHACAAGSPNVVPSKSDFKRLVSDRNRDIGFFAAHFDGKSIGRIMVHAPRTGAGADRTACFAHFDCTDDPEAARALLEIATSWARARGAARLIGNVALTDLPELGVVTDGRAPDIGQLLVGNGFAPVGDLATFRLDLATAHPPGITPAVQALMDDPDYSFAPHSAALFGHRLAEAALILTTAIQQVAPFVPPFQVRMQRGTNPNFCAVLQHKGRPVGCCLAVPDQSLSMPLSDPGRTWPLLDRVRRFRLSGPRAVVLLSGVLPQFQNLAITSLLLRKVMLALQAGGYDSASTHCTADLDGLDVAQPGVSLQRRLQLFSKAV